MSKYDNRDLWAKSYYSIPEMAGKVDLWKLEASDDDRLALYVSKARIVSGRGGNEDMLGRMPVYHVWDRNDRLYCGQSLREAYNTYYHQMGIL